MKKLLALTMFALLSLTTQAQNILGKWKTEAGNANVEIYQQGGKVNGKIIWLEKGPDTKDSHNPDAKLRERKLMGVNILSDLTKKGDKWEGGKIYDPKSGKTYKCSIWMDGNKLKVRGHLGIFHDTQTWKRVK
jgi:uncharacterized protein (DUF2147 family)